MKKLLSLLLALAIVISCVSMVTFNASAEEATATPDSVQMNIIAKGDNYQYNSVQNIFTSDASFTGYKEIHLAVKNIGDTPAALNPSIQITVKHQQAGYTGDTLNSGNGWKTPTGTIFVNTGATIEAGKTEFMSIYVPVENGKVYYPCNYKGEKTDSECIAGRHGNNMNTIWFRFNPTATTSFVITCLNPEENNVNSALVNIGGRAANSKSSTEAVVGSDHITDAEKTRKGVELSLINAATTSHYAVANAKLTKDMVKDGVISKSYEVYNTSDHTVSFFVAYQAEKNSAWNSIGVGKVYEIPAQTKLTYDLDIPVTIKEDDSAVVEYNGTEYDLSSLVLRCQFERVSFYNTKGSTVIVKANGEDDPLLDVVSNVQPNVTRKHVNTIPELNEGTPDLSSFKLVNITGGVTSKQTISINAGYKTFDTTFNDRLYATYTVYNSSATKDAKVNIFFSYPESTDINGNTINLNSIYNWEKTVPAGSKMDFKISALLTGGTITYTYTDKTDPDKPVSKTAPLDIEKLLLNVDVTVSSGTVAGDAIVIQATGDTPNAIIAAEKKFVSTSFYIETPVFCNTRS